MCTYSTDKNLAANLEVITAERARDIIAMNKHGEKPLSLLMDDKAKEEKKPNDLLADADVSRFDKSKKKKKNKKGKPAKAKATQDNNDNKPAADNKPATATKPGAKKAEPGNKLAPTSRTQATRLLPPTCPKPQRRLCRTASPINRSL